MGHLIRDDADLDPQRVWRKKIDEGASPLNGTQIWLVSFADLLSILLCCFVMVYAMKDPDEMQISQLFGKAGFVAGSAYKSTDGDSVGANIARTTPERGLDLGYLEAILAGRLAENNLADVIGLQQENGRILLRMPDGGSALQYAANLGAALSGIGNVIRVVGVPSGMRLGDFESALNYAQQFADVMYEGGFKGALLVEGRGYNANANDGGQVMLYVEGYTHKL